MAENKNGKSLIWRSAVGILVAVLSFLSSFMFTRVVGFPEKYVSKQDNKEMHISQDVRQEKLEQKIDEGFKQIQEQYIEINQYLRDRANERRREKPDGG
jgi:hypothetical protein